MGFSKIALIVLLIGFTTLMGWLTYLIVFGALYFIIWWGIRIGADIYYALKDR